MAKRAWSILLGGRSHTVELEHSAFSAYREVRVDGVAVWIDPATQYRVVDKGSIHPFEIAGVPCAVYIRARAIGYAYDLVVDGKVHPTGEGPDRPAPPPAHLGVMIHFEQTPRAVALVFAAFGVACAVGAVRLAQTLSARPSAPMSVALTSLADVPDGTWVRVDGLDVVCAAPPVLIDEDRYRLAGMGGPRTLLLLETHADTACARDHATGSLSTPTPGYPLARELSDRFGGFRVRVLHTWAGPDNDRLGIAVCMVGVMGSTFLAAFAWVRRERVV